MTLNDALQEVVPPLCNLLLPLLGSAALAALSKLAQYLHEKAAASKAAGVAAVFTDLAKSTVAMIDVELRPQLTAALADGKITAEEGRALRDHALAILKSQVPGKLLGSAAEIFGALGVDTWLKGLIERAHSELPPAANNMPAPAPALPADPAGASNPS